MANVSWLSFCNIALTLLSGRSKNQCVIKPLIKNMYKHVIRDFRHSWRTLNSPTKSIPSRCEVEARSPCREAPADSTLAPPPPPPLPHILSDLLLSSWATQAEPLVWCWKHPLSVFACAWDRLWQLWSVLFMGQDGFISAIRWAHFFC